MYRLPRAGADRIPWPGDSDTGRSALSTSAELRLMSDQMRRTPPDRPGRLPAPRAVLVPRSRLAPLAIALPLVLGLWLTIGLPILAEVSGTAGGGGPMRDFLFRAAATGGQGSGGDKRDPAGGTVA